jgi:hypothetical protein
MIRMTRAKLVGLGLATLGCSAVLTAGVAAAGSDRAEQPTLRITLTGEDLDGRGRPAQQPSQSSSPGDRDCPKGAQPNGETPAQPNPAEENV